ncbi:hypothetical protein NC652_009110, partial [Populus alba x Populus x berolinensis]
ALYSVKSPLPNRRLEHHKALFTQLQSQKEPVFLLQNKITMAMATNLYTSYSIIATKAHNNKSVSLSLQPGTSTTSHVKFTLPIQKRTRLPISAASTTATQVEGPATSSKASKTLPFRVGHGFDLHRLEPGYPLIIGGIDVPHDRGCEAHSDGDVLLHCVVDAILGALGLPDIGQIFPDSDPKWKGAPSSVFIKEAPKVVWEQAFDDQTSYSYTLVAFLNNNYCDKHLKSLGGMFSTGVVSWHLHLDVRLMHEAGYEIGNLDATLILQRPKLSPHKESMRANLSELLGADPSVVNLKAKTHEKVDSLGENRSIAAHTVVLLMKK